MHQLLFPGDLLFKVASKIHLWYSRERYLSFYAVVENGVSSL